MKINSSWILLVILLIAITALIFSRTDCAPPSPTRIDTTMTDRLRVVHDTVRDTVRPYLPPIEALANRHGGAIVTLKTGDSLVWRVSEVCLDSLISHADSLSVTSDTVRVCYNLLTDFFQVRINLANRVRTLIRHDSIHDTTYHITREIEKPKKWTDTALEILQMVGIGALGVFIGILTRL